MNQPSESEKASSSESAVVPGLLIEPTFENHLAWIRIRLSADTALMAWMSLATTLIGFGFALVQFFFRLRTIPNIGPALAPNVPRYVGLALILSGVLGLLIAMRQYVRVVTYLDAEQFSRIQLKTLPRFNWPTLTIAVVLVVIGSAAFVSIILRLL